MKVGILSNPIFLILGVPLLFLVVVGLIGYTPSLFVHPKHNFLYFAMDNYYGNENPNYSIENAQLKYYQNPTSLPPLSGINPETAADRRIRELQSMRLYIFDVSDWKSLPISYEDAQKFRYDSASVSPDGYFIERSESAGGFFPFFFNDSSSAGFIIKKGIGSRSLPISIERYSYRGPGLIGWVLQ